MKTALITLPASASAVAFALAADAHFGTGAAEWIIALCLSDPNRMVEAMPLPMKHSDHAVLYGMAGFALGATALFASSKDALDETQDHAGPSSDGEIAVLAALSVLAARSTTHGPADILAGYQRATGAALEMSQAVEAFSIFSDSVLEEDLDLFRDLERHADRRMVICAALEFMRAAKPTRTMVGLVGKIAQAMVMDAAEVEEHWMAHRQMVQDEVAPPALATLTGRLGEAVDALASMRLSVPDLASLSARSLRLPVPIRTSR